MKKLLAIFVATVLLVGAAACGTPSAPASTPAPPAPSASTAEPQSPAPSGEAPASAWVPEKDITFIVPFEAGGTADIPARIVAQYMSKYSAKPITVVNMPGAGGRIGAKEVQKSKPDGYTIMHVPVGWYMQYATGVADFTYQDFEPITMWVDSWLGLVVKGDSPYNTYEEFIAAAKAKPGALKVGGVTGTLPILAEMAIQTKEDVSFNLVDLGTGAKAPELLSGRIEAYVDGVGGLKQYVDAGQFKCLMTFSHGAVPGFDGVANADDLGYQDFDYLLQSFGMWAPKGTPKEAIDYMANLVKQASEDPECQKDLAALSYGATYQTPEDYAKTCEEILNGTIEAVKPLLG